MLREVDQLDLLIRFVMQTQEPDKYTITHCENVQHVTYNFFLVLYAANKLCMK